MGGQCRCPGQDRALGRDSAGRALDCSWSNKQGGSEVLEPSSHRPCHPQGSLLHGQLPPFLRGFFQSSEPVVERVMGTVSDVLHRLGACGLGVQSLSIAINARSFFNDVSVPWAGQGTPYLCPSWAPSSEAGRPPATLVLGWEMEVQGAAGVCARAGGPGRRGDPRGHTAVLHGAESAPALPGGLSAYKHRSPFPGKSGDKSHPQLHL